MLLVRNHRAPGGVPVQGFQVFPCTTTTTVPVSFLSRVFPEDIPSVAICPRGLHGPKFTGPVRDRTGLPNESYTSPARTKAILVRPGPLKNLKFRPGLFIISQFTSRSVRKSIKSGPTRFNFYKINPSNHYNLRMCIIQKGYFKKQLSVIYYGIYPKNPLIQVHYCYQYFYKNKKLLDPHALDTIKVLRSLRAS